MVIFQLQLAAMQPCHRRRETQSQTGAGLRAALFEPHEALDHAAALGLRYARTVIGDRQRNAVALRVGSEHDFGGSAIDFVRQRPGIVDGVVD